MHADTSQLRAHARAAFAGAGKIAVGSKAAAAKTAAEIEADMKARAAVLTGEMRDSVGTTPVGAAAYEIGPTSPHSEFVENGTSVMAPEPFVGPAFDAKIGGLSTKVAAIGATVL